MSGTRRQHDMIIASLCIAQGTGRAYLFYADPGYGYYGRKDGGKNQCNEVCQYNRLIGLDSSEETTTSTTEENQTESSTEPCIGRCQLEKTNKIEKDPELNSLKSRKSKRCVGLCYILRKKGQKVDPHLEELQKRRPCVGLCCLLKKKMDELDIEDENFQ